MEPSSGLLLSELDLPSCLQERIHVRPTAMHHHNNDHNDDHQKPPDRTNTTNNNNKRSQEGSFVLYLPTVVLRKTHNPAFALACRLANHHELRLVVLAVVVDDAHVPHSHSTTTTTNQNANMVVMTARRLAFVLEALQVAAMEWQAHGASVWIRVHGGGGDHGCCRTPHHLTLARQAVAVVCDEPFCHPHLCLVESVEKAVLGSTAVPCFRVDGSTIVPPAHVLSSSSRPPKLPNKAWKWEERTKSQRQTHVLGAVEYGHLDAPSLVIRVEAENSMNTSIRISNTNGEEKDVFAMSSLLSEWRKSDRPAPGPRPWTANELHNIRNLKAWAMQWPGADSSVRPCYQTHGAEARVRWNRFRHESLSSYAKQRNQVRAPHSVSRMSCYLNYGAISIFQVIHDVWQHPSSTAKYQDEILKWREMSYAHAFANPQTYNTVESVPRWARQYLDDCRKSSRTPVSLEKLLEGQSDDPTWNAMQQYLVATGELHNNARMTWGKTVVYWQKWGVSADVILAQLCRLNDRYALDGLSPPSYAGLLWCLGWCDKPSADQSIAEKVAWQYRTGPEGFQEAKEKLIERGIVNGEQPSMASMLRPRKKQRNDDQGEKDDSGNQSSSTYGKSSEPNTIVSYFSSSESR